VNSTTLSTGIRAETAVSQPQSPRAWIERQIHECNIYIGVYSHRYGWVIPDEDVSATEFEFNLARKLGKPILVWIRKLRKEEKSKPNIDRQEQFLNRVSDFSTGHLRQEFDNPAELEKKIADGLGELFTEMIRKSHFPIKPPKPLPSETPSWFQNPSFRNADSSPSESKKIQLEALVTELIKDKTKRFAIVGKSGSGKSVAMKAITHSLSNRDDNAAPCIYVPLGNYAQNLANTVKSNIGWQDVPDDKVLIELGNLGATILLDALNEVPGAQRDQCRNEIKMLCCKDNVN
jgi:ATPase subunit of ABC transporter with duplicated ATPase domains